MSIENLLASRRPTNKNGNSECGTTDFDSCTIKIGPGLEPNKGAKSLAKKCNDENKYSEFCLGKEKFKELLN